MPLDYKKVATFRRELGRLVQLAFDHEDEIRDEFLPTEKDVSIEQFFMSGSLCVCKYLVCGFEQVEYIKTEDFMRWARGHSDWEEPEPTPEYANADDLRKLGIDPRPRHGDRVMWTSNLEQWVVNAKDDIEGQSALHLWEDGGWCNVVLRERPINVTR